MEIITKQGIAIVKMVDNINSGNVAGLQSELLAMLESKPAKVIFDFSANRYMSSAGLRMLMEVSNRIEQQQGQLVLAAVAEAVQEVFEMTGFCELFTIVTTITEAEQTFK